MNRNKHPSSVPTRPSTLSYTPVAGPGGYYADGVEGNTQGTIVTADHLNTLTDEVSNVITGLGGSLDETGTNSTQLLSAILKVGVLPQAGDANKIIRVNAGATGLEVIDNFRTDNNGAIRVSGTSHIGIPYGPTAARPVSPLNGSVRINITTNQLEWYVNDAWHTGDGIPSGTIALFFQAAAPVGWTQITTASINDAAIRITSGTGGAVVGGLGFTTALAADRNVPGSVTVNGTALSVNQIPSHTHSVIFDEQDIGGGGTNMIPAAGNLSGTPYSAITSPGVQPTGGGAAHAHTASFNGSIDLNVKYLNCILCVKN